MKEQIVAIDPGIEYIIDSEGRMVPKQSSVPMDVVMGLVSALKICANRKECHNNYECCGKCGPIYEAEEALEKFEHWQKGCGE